MRDELDGNQNPQQSQDSSVGFISPGPPVNPGTEASPPLVMSSWHRMLSSFEAGAVSGNIMQGYREKRKFILQADTSSPLLNNDEIKELRKDRQGIVFPKYIRKSTADALTKEYDTDQARELILNSTQPTETGKILGGTGRFLGTVLGSPIESAAELAITHELPISKLLGVSREALGESLAQRALSRAKLGIVEGGAFGGIQDVVDDTKSIMNGESISPVQNIYNIAQNMFWGGALHPIGGFIGDKFKSVRDILKNRSLVDKDGSDDVNTSSAQNAEAGQDPNIEVPVKNAAARGANDLKQEMEDNNITQEEMLDGLDDAKDNIESSIDENNDNISKIKEEAEGRELSDEESNTLDKLNDKKEELDLASKAEEVHRFMVNNPDLSVTKNEYDQFGSQLDDPEQDFARGRGHEDLPDQGAPIKNEQTNLNDRFPKDAQEDLLKDSKLTDIQKDELDNIRKSPDRISVLRKALSSTIMCLTGV